MQNTITFPLIFQSYEQQKKKQKSALAQTGDWCVRDVFVLLVVGDLSVAFLYWVCVELFAGDKSPTAVEFYIIHVFFVRA